MPPDRGLADRKLSGVKAKKTRLTYAFTCNADGSDKLPPFVIGKYKKPRLFKGKTGAELGFNYHNNAKAWMTAILYTHWIEKWDADLTAKGRKVLLLQDNFSGHIVPPDLCSIRVENFEYNLTPHVQPDDQSIIRTFKAHYRVKYVERAIDRYDRGISPSNIYDIDILTAMRWPMLPGRKSMLQQFATAGAVLGFSLILLPYPFPSHASQFHHFSIPVTLIL